MNIRTSLAGAMLAGLAPLAHAATTVNCSVSAGSIAFGVYNPLSAVADASTGTLRITCNGSGTGSANVTVNLSLSAGLSGSYATRKMFSGANALNYNIYWSTAYSQIMGDGSGGSFGGSAGPFVVPAGGSNFATGTMYGRIPALQDVAPGSYSDVITVTVTY
ncbi:MAG TPA: spore coat U domain-containing protein [Steroidobacteraceae bacterium]|jgi:spore coat protein U-like protein|nr:spore coat U domain-containing protein [Steroidobacteraceae bacterium]